MENIFNICNYIIQSENENGRAVTNMRLQKLLYLVQATYLKNFNEGCFSERIEAWQYGPVVPTVYHYFKMNGPAGIPIQHVADKDEIIKKPEVKQVIDVLLKYTANLETGQLIDITHTHASWRNAVKSGFGTEISLDAMRQEFSRA